MSESHSAKLAKQAPFYLVREDILPEALLKTLQMKESILRGEYATVGEAAEKIGLSRSAYYKYKDGIFPLNRIERERIVTVSIDLEHRSGVLSRVLALVASFEGNVLTIHQTIPLQGLANVVLSIETSGAGETLEALMQAIRSEDGVRRASLIGQG
ncbi:ACT domain-containing protein [Paenibacillus thermotolerans]|uniref:ACT domain-containing protein n=1 Tax=Paenibacillus thermotolerans TaxID=3027807 RepID=UPI002368EFCD|nr:MULTISPECIES: ACT domain-containing protein [unclassified Paenibacillus]